MREGSRKGFVATHEAWYHQSRNVMSKRNGKNPLRGL